MTDPQSPEATLRMITDQILAASREAVDRSRELRALVSSTQQQLRSQRLADRARTQTSPSGR